MKKIVVLGGTGFIGIHVLKWLVGLPDVELLWVKRPDAALPDIKNLPPPKLVEDLETIDIACLADADAIVDLVSRGRGRMIERRDINLRVRAHLRIIDGLLNAESKTHYIFMSSGGAIYGQSPVDVLKETTPCFPQTEYGLEKLIIESALLSASQTGFETSILRVTNAYGLGQASKPGFGVIPTLVNALQTGTPFKVFGSGNMQRDYINVIDIQRAIAAAMEIGGLGVLNIGSGQGTSINDLISQVQDLTDLPLNIENIPADKNEPKYLPLDIARAKDVLGWEPTVTLRDGLTQILHEAKLLRG